MAKKNIKKRFVIIVLILLIFVLAVVVYFILNNQSVNFLRVCPEEWYINRMPSTVGSSGISNEYFVYNDERRELSEFDVNWVKIHCSVKPKVVY